MKTPTPTGEWTAEWLQELWAKTWATEPAKRWQVICDAHAADLAAERERYDNLKFGVELAGEEAIRQDQVIQQLRAQLAARDLLVKQLEQEVEAKERRCNEIYERLAAATEDKRVVMHAHAVYQDNTNLKQQLAAAQASIVEHNKHVEEMHTATSDDCYEIPLHDTTALGDYVKEKLEVAERSAKAWEEDAKLYATNSEDYKTKLAAAQAEILKYRKAMDALYNHNEAVRHAVIEHFGIHHVYSDTTSLDAERELRKKSDEFRERLKAKHRHQSDALDQAKEIIQQLRTQLDAQRKFNDASHSFLVNENHQLRTQLADRDFLLRTWQDNYADLEKQLAAVGANRQTDFENYKNYTADNAKLKTKLAEAQAAIKQTKEYLTTLANDRTWITGLTASEWLKALPSDTTALDAYVDERMKPIQLQLNTALGQLAQDRKQIRPLMDALRLADKKQIEGQTWVRISDELLAKIGEQK